MVHISDGAVITVDVVSKGSIYVCKVGRKGFFSSTWHISGILDINHDHKAHECSDTSDKT